MSSTPCLLEIKNLSVAFEQKGETLLAVEDFSLKVETSQMVGLVGESGCGKSLSSLAILGLLPNNAKVPEGEILLNGQDLRKLDTESLRKLRGNQIALIPQDPMTALNPVYTIGEQLAEVLIEHKGLTEAEALRQSALLLDKVKIPNAKARLNDYPHQFSGGMRQRVMIAMAISCNPKLLIADEPTTALDVTVQAQILELMQGLMKELETGILLITHDLGVVAETCDKVCVMYAGQIVEEATTSKLFASPKHPYTQGLIASLPKAKSERLAAIKGQPPGIRKAHASCVFEPRCEKRMDSCKTTKPLLATFEEQQVRCLLY